MKKNLLGTRYVTGEKAPVRGVYMYDGHANNSPCLVILEEGLTIHLSKGQKFPHRQTCGQAAVWKLVQQA